MLFHLKTALEGSTKTEEMLSCFKITANRFKNSYKLVIIDSPWLPIILNFSLYAIIQDLTPYTTERNKYHFIYHNSFRYGFLIKLIDGAVERKNTSCFFISGIRIHNFSVGKARLLYTKKRHSSRYILHLRIHKDFSLVNLAAKSSQSHCYQHQL